MIDLKDMNNLDTDQNKLECIKVFIGSLNFGLHTNQFVREDFTFVTLPQKLATLSFAT